MRESGSETSEPHRSARRARIRPGSGNAGWVRTFRKRRKNSRRPQARKLDADAKPARIRVIVRHWLRRFSMQWFLGLRPAVCARPQKRLRRGGVSLHRTRHDGAWTRAARNEHGPAHGSRDRVQILTPAARRTRAACAHGRANPGPANRHPDRSRRPSRHAYKRTGRCRRRCTHRRRRTAVARDAVP